MSSRAKRVLNFTLIFGTLIIVLVITFSGANITDTVKAIRGFPPLWLCACFVAYALGLLTEALSLYFFLKRQGSPINYGYAIFVTIVGQYYSNITPGATGGQPMQVFYLRKRGIPIGIATSALLVKMFCFQFMLMTLGTLFWVTHREFVAYHIGGNMWILILGYTFNAIVVAFLLLVAINKRLVRFITHFIIRILTKLKICKNPDRTHLKWDVVVDSFHSSISLLRKQPLDLLGQLLLGGAQTLLLMMITVFVYWGFNLRELSVSELTTMGILQYTSAGYTPLPGASGAQEGVFALFFGKIFPDHIRMVALLIWRFFTYYLSLIVGAVTTIAYGVHERRKESNIVREETDTADEDGNEPDSAVRSAVGADNGTGMGRNSDSA